MSSLSSSHRDINTFIKHSVLFNLDLGITDEAGGEKPTDGDEFASVTESELAEDDVGRLSDEEGMLHLTSLFTSYRPQYAFYVIQINSVYTFLFFIKDMTEHLSMMMLLMMFKYVIGSIGSSVM